LVTPLDTSALPWAPTRERPRTLADVAAVGAREFADAIAITDGERRISYAELEAGVARVAAALHVEPGDRVALLCANRAEFWFGYLGIARAGAVSVPLGTRLSVSELAFLIDHAECRALLHGAEHADVARALAGAVERLDLDALPDGGEAPTAAPDPASDAAIFYTSGTTDSPKGVRLTHEGILHCATVCGNAFEITGDDVALALLPLYHTSTHFIALPTLMAGGTVVVHEGFNADAAFALLERHGVTLFPTVSAVATLMAKHAERTRREGGLEHLRMVYFGGAGVPDSLLASWARFAPSTAIANVFGLTEMGPAVAGHIPTKHPPKPGTVGPPYAGIAVRIDGDPGPGAVGEILVRGRSMMAGYWRNEDATRAALRDGWLHTGDLGFLDEDGFLSISGRQKHMLKRGGENVFPNEVEAVIIRHPAVKEVIVVGVPDEVMGERVAALLSPQPGARLEPEEVVAICAEQLAEFKVPELVAVLEPELPKNSVGKVDLRGLHAKARDAGFEFLEFRRGRPVRR